MTIDAARFRATLALVPTSVAVVTTVTEVGRRYGVTVGSFCSLSLHPPLVLFSLTMATRSYLVLSAAPSFAVNVLRADQREVAERFASSGTDRFAGISVGAGGPDRLPVIPGAIATIHCTRHDVVRAGDHGIITGLVQDTETNLGQPLIYCQHDYRGHADSRLSTVQPT